jgi:transposase
MRPVGTVEELERRRRRAVQLLEDGHSLTTVAQRVGAAVSAVWTWRKQFREHGEASLAAKPAPGRPLKLKPRQRERLLRVLARGARAAGHPNELWTTRRIARLIEREFDVTYHPAHVSRILAECGWSWQKPQHRAVERDEAAIAQWKKRRWVEIKKKPAA